MRNLFSIRSRERNIIEFVLLALVFGGNAFAAQAVQEIVPTAPPAWRAAGSSDLDGGPFVPRPLDTKSKAVQRLSPVDPAAFAKKTVVPKSTTLASNGNFSAMSASASSDADFRTPELIALAAGLKNDRNLIFLWVRQNIRYVHYHGCKKGAHLTYLERSGNDADQSALLVALWRAAGIDCQYAFGLIEMPVSAVNQIDWQHYLGVDTSELEQLVFSRGTPAGYFGIYSGHAANTRAMTRVWVQANVDGQWINYDPSFKLIQLEVGFDRVAAMGYNRAALLSSLGNGTTGTNSITSLSYSGLSAYLSDRVTQFLSTYKSSYFDRTVVQTVGGSQPLENATVAGSSFPISAAGYFWGLFSGQTYDILPASFYSTIQIQASSVGLNWGPVNMASLRGQRLGLLFELPFLFSAKATLKLDDTQVAQASAFTNNGSALAINVSIVHADSGSLVPGVQINESNAMTFKGGGTYALVYGFDVSPESMKARQEKLSSYQELGLGDADSRMRLETLNVIGMQWLLQTEMSHQLVANLKNQSPAYLHRFGRVAQEPATSGNSLYIDVPLNYSGFVSRGPDPGSANRHVAEMVDSFVGSAMEHGVIEQTQPATGSGVLSTTKILKLANERNIPIYLANGANYLSYVRGQLTGYGAGNLAIIDDAIADGGEALLPKSGQINLNQWTGSGYAYSVLSTSELRQGMIIGGIYSGGFSSIYTTAQSYAVISQSNASSTRFQHNPVTIRPTYGLDPVDLATGDFTHERELLTAGEGLVRGLNLSVSYHGGRRTKNEAKLGYGWTHSYYVRATELADIEGAFGRKTPIEMASSIVGAVAAMDVFANRTGVKDWLGTALVANWMVDQLKGSAVSIVSGDKIWQFHKQPNGTYTAPPGATQELTKLANYQLVERNGPTWRFDSSMRLSEIEDIWGKKLTLTYNASGDLGTVADAYARTLTFAYQTPGGGGTRVDVTDNAGRIVHLWANSSGDMTSFSDAEGKSDIFQYATGHLLTTYKNHDNNIVVTNTYDAAGRITTQDTMGDSAKRWKLYYAPGLTIEEEPSGTQPALTYHYFDSRNREVELANALGHRLLMAYDAQDRVVGKQRLVGSTINETEFRTYDVNHNLLTETDPKSKVTTYTYDGNNRLTSIVDKRGNTQLFQNYNAQHQPMQTTDREGRVVSFTYKAAADPGAGSVATVTEGGFTTTYGYDARGALNSISYPGGASESLVNNFLGDPTTKTDALSRVTTIAYNQRREVTSTTTPGTATSGTRTTTTTYDNKRDVATVQNPRGFTTSTVYSVTHKLLTTILPGGAAITNHYDSRDHLDWTSNPLGQTTSFGLDALGRTTAATDPLLRTTSTIFQDDQRKTISQSPSPLNIQTKVTVDERGQPVRNEDGLGNYAVPGYDNNGNKTTWVDRRGKTWGFTYDKEDRLQNTTSPLARTTGQGWNGRGLLETITEPSAQVTTLGYDNRRRLTSRADAVGTVNYGLDNAGQVLTVTQGAAVLTRTYHPSGEVATYRNVNNETISYDYDKNGNLTSLTYPAIGSVPAATVSYGYDNRDRLTSVTDWAGRVTMYSWDAAGRLTLVTRPNGTKRRLSWDAAGQMLAVEERPASGAPFVIRSFGYDSVGRIVKRLSFPQATAWTEPILNAGVDNDNRLTGGVLNYDADGNTLASLLPPGPWGWTGGSATAEPATFEWNARNQLTFAHREDNYEEVTYTYDAEGNLVWSSSSYQGATRWIIDPSGGERPRILAKVAPNGSVTRYIYGFGLVYEARQDGSMRYYHYDQVGSTIALTDGAGAVKGRADYSPYGTLQSTSGELANANVTPFLFVGAFGVITDSATGLQQMRARWYSSYTRRFLSEDPTGFAGGENFYAYASGNPISMIDPLGLEPWQPDSRYQAQIVGNREIMQLLQERKDYLEDYSALNGSDPDLVRSIIIHESRGFGNRFERLEAQVSWIRNGYEGTFGYAQLGFQARRAADLSIEQAQTMRGSIRGASKWLAVSKRDVRAAGVSKPSVAQIASQYNSGRQQGLVSNYGRQVDWTYNGVRNGSIGSFHQPTTSGGNASRK